MLKHLIKESTGNFISLEICTQKEVKMDLIRELKPLFCSIPWFRDSQSKLDEGNLDEIPALLLANRLQSGGQTVVLHLAGKDLTQESATKLLEKIRDNGIKNILALQGNPSSSGEKSKICDFPYAGHFVKFIRKHFGDYFSVGVAGYPDKHPESESLDMDLRRLKEKVECGADYIITQAVFDYDQLKIFCSKCREIGIDVPIIPGIFIMNTYESMQMMINMCKVHIPSDVRNYIEENKNDKTAIESYGMELAQKLIRNIFENKLCPGVHIFTLNRLDMLRKLHV